MNALPQATTTSRPTAPAPAPAATPDGVAPFAHATARVEVVGPPVAGSATILTPEALAFLTELHVRFAGRRHDLLLERQRRQERYANGLDPDFLPETAGIRADPTWRVAGAGPGLVDRRVEITGPTDRKMTVNALNSGARVWLADQEDATSPTWENVVGGQHSLYDAIRGQVDFVSPEGKEYRVGPTTPTIVMRPRGWHLAERHLRFVDRAGQRAAASASLVDFGLYAFHNATALVAAGRGPYFYLPKIENRLEGRLWDDVFTVTETYLGLPHGTIRATVLIETITAAFEMEEILYELRDHCAGLNAGRWDYIFSIIKTFRERGPRYVLPDRSQVTMDVPFMRAYTDLLVATCHRRGAHAIGGMSAFIPNRRDPEVTARALDQVRADKEREAGQGFDGTWVAHPDLVPVAREVFDATLGDRPNQLDRLRDDVRVTAAQLLDFRSANGRVTEAGVRGNVAVAVRYLDSWLRGTGAAALDNLMEDAATAEISRSQIWQWVHHGTETAEGRRISRAWVAEVLSEVVASLPRSAGDRVDDAAALFRQVALADEYPSFLTLSAYAQHLVQRPEGPVPDRS
ncbi:malate synthase A [Actinotalea fermentans]|uniref:Malate synthase n=1 Tax=Actinotalea fermentans TaxID=43671 RepID=A0A511YTT2_9CELL|nr:malate synthase A [Actinotalea fermentans]KGM17728.1 malate synthase [Actinotalea fermentans ATCC 43279 = JCM 9966 = DSM 3133]GEN78603.1 malate synthase [Actinotalea fermentans]